MGMELEDAHWKLSKYPAQAAGLLDRGHIAEGMPADIIIYDYEALKIGEGHVAYDLPGDDWRRICRADGYQYTIVNGQGSSRARSAQVLLQANYLGMALLAAILCMLLAASS